MTNTLKAAFEHAALAQAAYINLSEVDNANLKLRLEEGGMTEFMAKYIADRYTVTDSFITGGLANPIGYQGIIFQEIGTQNYVLANRGTEASPSVANNALQDIIVDLVGI